jgi:hypothetical protein
LRLGGSFYLERFDLGAAVSRQLDRAARPPHAVGLVRHLILSAESYVCDAVSFNSSGRFRRRTTTQMRIDQGNAVAELRVILDSLSVSLIAAGAVRKLTALKSPHAQTSACESCGGTKLPWTPIGSRSATPVLHHVGSRRCQHSSIQRSFFQSLKHVSVFMSISEFFSEGR